VPLVAPGTDRSRSTSRQSHNATPLRLDEAVCGSWWVALSVASPLRMWLSRAESDRWCRSEQCRKHSAASHIVVGDGGAVGCDKRAEEAHDPTATLCRSASQSSRIALNMSASTSGPLTTRPGSGLTWLQTFTGRKRYWRLGNTFCTIRSASRTVVRPARALARAAVLLAQLSGCLLHGPHAHSLMHTLALCCSRK
jgi:hypothetical protein